MNHFKTSVCFLGACKCFEDAVIEQLFMLLFFFEFSSLCCDRLICFILIAISIWNKEAPGFGRKLLKL